MNEKGDETDQEEEKSFSHVMFSVVKEQRSVSADASNR